MYNYAFADINRIKNTFWLSFFYTRNENVLRRFCIIKLYNDHTKIQSTDKKHALATGLHLYYLSTNENVTPGEGNAVRSSNLWVNEFAHL